MKDIMGMMKKAQEMQARMGEMQAELEALEVVGTAGGDAVQITLTGKGEMRGVKIEPSLLKPDEAEIVEDLIIAAHADAKQKSEALAQEKMKEVTAGLPIPPGMKMPF